MMMEKAPDRAVNFRTADGLFAVDLEHRIRMWSPAAEQITGYTAQDVLGRLCYEVVGGRDARNHKFCRRNCPIISNARRGRTTPHYDVLSERADGSPIWLNLSVLLPERQTGKAHSDENGKGRGKGTGKKDGNSLQVLHLFRDVTRRRALEERARRAMEAIHAVVEAEKTDGLTLESEDELALPPMPELSRREREVLRLLALGFDTNRVAESLGVSRVTARNHISRALSKLGVQSRLQAVVYASQRGLV